MTIWMVFIRQNDAAGAHVCRWIDSMWADNKHAVSRAVEVRDSMKACGAVRHEVFYTTGEVADAAIPDAPDTIQSVPSQSGRTICTADALADAGRKE